MVEVEVECVMSSSEDEAAVAPIDIRDVLGFGCYDNAGAIS